MSTLHNQNWLSHHNDILKKPITVPSQILLINTANGASGCSVIKAVCEIMFQDGHCGLKSALTNLPVNG